MKNTEDNEKFGIHALLAFFLAASLLIQAWTVVMIASDKEPAKQCVIKKFDSSYSF